MLLPRPISICDISKDEGLIRFVYRKVGGGTGLFSNLKPGDSLKMIAPLGNGYEVLDKINLKDKNCLAIGGGIGIPPMLLLSKVLSQAEANVTAVLGYRTDDLFLSEDFEPYAELLISTDDGKAGVKGTVIDAITASGVKADMIFACGPMPMLRGVKVYAEKESIEAYVSLEEHMACGIGACLGCICKTVEVDSHSHVKNARICKDGPVFNAKDIEI
jgi:dihydroorotate dehydrogenase electron transfer subunit